MSHPGQRRSRPGSRWPRVCSQTGGLTMKDPAGKVALVTGAAGGIGRAMAERFAQEGMKVVLADIEEETLQATVRDLKQQERDVIGVVTDVSKPEAVDDLARRTIDAYG